MKLIPLLLLFSLPLSAQSLEIKNESDTCVKVITNIEDRPRDGEEYIITVEADDVTFIHKRGNSVIRAVSPKRKDFTWKARKGEKLIILIK